MKTLKSLFAISAILLVSGYTYATEGPGDNKNINGEVREKIATAIESADLQGQGEVTLKFGVTEKSNLQILNVESSDKSLSNQVRGVLENSNINFPQGSKGIYKIKVLVNEQKDDIAYNTVRDQVLNAVSEMTTAKSGTVDVKLRVVYPYYVKVLKAESNNAELAEMVKKTLESERLFVPQKLNGEYNVKVSFK